MTQIVQAFSSAESDQPDERTREQIKQLREHLEICRYEKVATRINIGDAYIAARYDNAGNRRAGPISPEHEAAITAARAAHKEALKTLDAAQRQWKLLTSKPHSNLCQ